MNKTCFVCCLSLICVTSTRAQLFFDNFTRPTDPVALASPWQTNSGDWFVTGSALRNGPVAALNYSYAFISTNVWTNYLVQARVRFSTPNAWGGGVGARLDSASGAHYGAWVYPEGSGGGSNVVALIKFQNYTSFQYNGSAYAQMAAVNLSNFGLSVGTNYHTLRLTVQANQIGIAFDGIQLTNVTDIEASPYTIGGASVETWADSSAYEFFADDFLVHLVPTGPVANNDSYNVATGTLLTVSPSGVLGNDVAPTGQLSAVLVTGPTRGNFSLNANGGFAYTATNNYVGPDSFTYRANDGVNNSAIATVSLTVTTNTPPVANADNYAFPANTASTVSAPGVLANDSDINGNTLISVLVASPTNGSVSLSANGGFVYTPNANYTGPDAFTYRVSDGLATSGVSVVSISVATPGLLFTDNFSRGSDPANLAPPWQINAGAWVVTGGTLKGGTNAVSNYGYAYVANTWTNYSVQARLQFSISNAWGGGIGGRLLDPSPTGGAHYGAWVYPELSAGGSNAVVLIKFSSWTTFSTLTQVPLGNVGTGFHTVKLVFAGNQIGIFVDGIQKTNVTDGDGPFLSGGVTGDMWTDSTGYLLSLDDVAVRRLVVEDYYNVDEDTLLAVSAGGVLTNDSGISGSSLSATLVSGTSSGTLNFNSDGSFTYLPGTNFVGTDSFTYQALDGGVDLGTAVVNLTVNSSGAGQRIYFENFDAVTAPALPAGWTTSATGAQSSWVAQAATSDSSPNSVFSPDPNNVGLNELVSPTIALPAGLARLAFRNNYNLEVASSTIAYDGAVLEIKIGGGAFTDILAAGGSFVAGGYNRIITNAFSNPLPNRPAWSGNSGGYISTVVNLPPVAAGQNIQLRWRCGTDSGTSAPGWRIDTVSITNCPSSACWNVPPTFAAQNNGTNVELATMTITNAATDYNVPADDFTYSLVTPPAGMSINTNTGVITWTPNEAQGPGTYTIRTRALDNGSPPLSSTNTFVVTVTETNNNSPVLPTQTNRTIIETLLMTVVNTATDADVPANTLTYSLLAAPTGAVISGSGVITWTPNDSQGGTTNTFTTRVADNVAPTLSATNTFVVTVLDTNNVPILPTQTNRTIAELTTLTITNTATDTDVPTNTFTYTLLVSPVGSAISTNGVITWTPGEASGPSTNTFTTRVVDSGVPPLSATNSFTVRVTEVNSPPILLSQTNYTIDELTTLIVTNTASDTDLPANVLAYSLVNPPGNASIDTNGVITWTPSESEGPGTNTIATVVSDGTVSVTNQFLVVVTDVNVSPVFTLNPSNQAIDELTLLTITNNATDSDLPANGLTYSLLDAPGDAVISNNGVITWTPTEAEGPGTNIITTVVSDGALSITNSFAVTVNEVNVPPIFVNSPANQTIDVMALLTVTNLATDADFPANGLSYSLLNPPSGVAIDMNGVITWIPTETQGSTTNTVTTIVTDNGMPALASTNFFSVTVVGQIAPPLIQSLTLSNGLVTVISSAVNGRTYRLQLKQSLNQTEWSDVFPEAIAANNSVILTNAAGAASESYYRVFLVPGP